MIKKSIFSTKFITTDKSIRAVLMDQLKSTYSAPNTAIIPELTLPIGSSRIDIAVVNGVMHGYELKSDFDSLERLQRQINAYNLIFDQVTLVVGKRHILSALSIIPNWWGVIIAKITSHTHPPLLLKIRNAKKNPNQDIKAVVSLLWKDEAVNILEQHTKKIKIKNLKKDTIFNELISVVPRTILKKQVRHFLIRRFVNSIQPIE